MRANNFVGQACAAALTVCGLAVGIDGVADAAPETPTNQAAPPGDICKGYSTTFFNQTVPNGASTYIIMHNIVRFKNCGNTPVKVRPDISLMQDPRCAVVQPGQQTKWDWQTTSAMNFFRGMAKC